jgi:hypothetical protein
MFISTRITRMIHGSWFDLPRDRMYKRGVPATAKEKRKWLYDLVI